MSGPDDNILLEFFQVINANRTEFREGETCEGCKHRWWVKAAPMGSSMSGWGCQRTGGHAVIRCVHYEE